MHSARVHPAGAYRADLVPARCWGPIDASGPAAGACGRSVRLVPVRGLARELLQEADGHVASHTAADLLARDPAVEAGLPALLMSRGMPAWLKAISTISLPSVGPPPAGSGDLDLPPPVRSEMARVLASLVLARVAEGAFP